MEHLIIWTIYKHGRDFPGHVVMRPHIIMRGRTVPGAFGGLYGSIEEARWDAEEMGLTCIGRYPSDEPCVVESWI